MVSLTRGEVREVERTYGSQEELRRACDAYFDGCDSEALFYGEAGLALGLGIKLATLRDWYDGRGRPDLQEEIQRAYLRIQAQLESSPAYVGKGMVTKSIFLLRQPRLGGYQDKTEAKGDITVHVKMGGAMDESDFE